MNSHDYRVATELKRRLAQAVPLIAIKVYGSKARGDEDEYSDLDVYIEVAELDKQIKERISDIVWEVGLENRMIISPLIFSSYEVADSPLRESPIVKNIKHEGILL